MSDQGVVLGSARTATDAPRWYFEGVRAEIRRALPVFLFSLIYAVGAVLLTAWLGTWHKLHITIYLRLALGTVLGFAPVAAIAALAVLTVRAALNGEGRPLAYVLRHIKMVRPSPHWITAPLLLTTFVATWGICTSVKTMLPDVAWFRWDQALANADAALHFGADPWRLLHAPLGHHHITAVIQFIYAHIWMTLTLLVPVCVIFSPRLAHLRNRFLLTYFMILGLLGNVIAGLMLSGGPVFYDKLTGDPERFRPLMEYLQDGGYSVVSLSSYLWGSYQSGGVKFGTGISAFPSVHVAVSTLFALLGWSINRGLGAVATVFAATILVGSVHLGWHYAIDGYASILGTSLIWCVTGWFDGRLSPKLDQA